MKVSLITVSYNSKGTIERTINSVISQTYSDIEYIVIDSCSDDGTVKVLQDYKKYIDHLVIEKDKGIYDAMNKGMKMASGELIGIINSDDFYTDSEVISSVVKYAKENEGIDAILTDISFINSNEFINREVSAKNFKKWQLRFGWMPPHPGMFLNRQIISRTGFYNLAYSIASDFDYCIRLFYQSNANFSYLNCKSVLMQEGGVSTKSIKSNFIITQEMHKALKENSIYSNYLILFLRLPIKFLFKVLSRLAR